jgi:hypothetical protein
MRGMIAKKMLSTILIILLFLCFFSVNNVCNANEGNSFDKNIEYSFPSQNMTTYANASALASLIYEIFGYDSFILDTDRTNDTVHFSHAEDNSTLQLMYSPNGNFMYLLLHFASEIATDSRKVTSTRVNKTIEIAEKLGIQIDDEIHVGDCSNGTSYEPFFYNFDAVSLYEDFRGLGILKGNRINADYSQENQILMFLGVSAWFNFDDDRIIDVEEATVNAYNHLVQNFNYSLEKQEGEPFRRVLIDYQNLSLDYGIIFWNEYPPDPWTMLEYEVIVNGNNGSVKEVNQRVVAEDIGDTLFNLQPVLTILSISVVVLIIIIGVIFLRKKQGQKDK